MDGNRFRIPAAFFGGKTATAAGREVNPRILRESTKTLQEDQATEDKPIVVYPTGYPGLAADLAEGLECIGLLHLNPFLIPSPLQRTPTDPPF